MYEIGLNEKEGEYCVIKNEEDIDVISSGMKFHRRIDAATLALCYNLRTQGAVDDNYVMLQEEAAIERLSTQVASIEMSPNEKKAMLQTIKKLSNNIIQNI